jgi:hypothetical protein
MTTHVSHRAAFFSFKQLHCPFSFVVGPVSCNIYLHFLQAGTCVKEHAGYTVWFLCMCTGRTHGHVKWKNCVQLDVLWFGGWPVEAAVLSQHRDVQGRISYGFRVQLYTERKLQPCFIWATQIEAFMFLVKYITFLTSAVPIKLVLKLVSKLNIVSKLALFLILRNTREQLQGNRRNVKTL